MRNYIEREAELELALSEILDYFHTDAEGTVFEGVAEGDGVRVSEEFDELLAEVEQLLETGGE